jgi:hypothetical protein
MEKITRKLFILKMVCLYIAAAVLIASIDLHNGLPLTWWHLVVLHPLFYGFIFFMIVRWIDGDYY